MKFLGKVGVIIDEGLDGVLDRLLPDPLGMVAQKSAISTLSTKQRYASAVRNAREWEQLAKRFMLDSQVKATASYNAYLQAVGDGADVDTIVRLALKADADDKFYMLEKHSWYEKSDELELATKRFENYLRFGQWEQSGMEVPDPETANYNFDPDAY